MPRLFAATIFLAATLLFWVEPMVAKMVLPRFGGGPAVWTTCMLFFQAVLLLGYGYAHLVSTRLARRWQVLFHLLLVLLPLLALPLAIPAGWVPPAEADPTTVLLGYLLLIAGLPFFVVSTTTPLVQQWFAASGSRHSADPYFLYAASNLGSALGLLSYPALLEPSFGLRMQGWLWAGAYGVLAVLLAACGLVVWRATFRMPAAVMPSGKSPAKPHTVPAATPPTWRARLHWVTLAFVPSSLMLGVTSYLTTDIAPVPMLWVLPLGLYLLTFVLAFGRLPPASYGLLRAVLPAVLLGVALVMVTEWTTAARYLGAMKIVIPLHLTAFFVTALVLHGQLAQERPSPRFLTEYFFWLSLGGVLGGVFNAVVAPLVFPSTWEYPISLVIALLLAPAFRPPSDARRALWLDGGLVLVVALVMAGVAAFPDSAAAGWRYVIPGAVCLAALSRPLRMGLCLGVLFAAHILEPPPGLVRLRQERNFFGVLTVYTDSKGYYNRFYHGKTNHGAQSRGPAAARRLPLLYFYPSGPIGQTFASLEHDDRKRPVAVVGLGAGTLAAYGRAGQQFTFFEIDPAVERVARTYFTYLADSPARCRVVLGDARLSLAREPDHHYGLIVLDAFSSDAPPVHLLTCEAMRIYLDKLAGDGIIAVNITNNYVDLQPVLAGIARACRLQTLAQLDTRITHDEAARGKKESHWVLLAHDLADFGALARSPRWQGLRPRKQVGVWTDDYSNLLRVLNWN
jgi:hypothetical protein